MSLAIKWGDLSKPETDSGLLFFDAVTSFTQSYKGAVTKHPIDKGGNITDHFINENPTFQVSAIFTGVGVGTSLWLITDDESNLANNSFLPPSEVSVNSTDASTLTKFLPDSIGQFLPDRTPSVTMDTSRENILEKIRLDLKNLSNGIKWNEKTNHFDPEIKLITLYEMDKKSGRLVRPLIDLVVTSLSFREDANTGYGLYADISFEQVTFVELVKTAIPKRPKPAVVKKAAPKVDKGTCDSTPKNPADAANKDTQGTKDNANKAADAAKDQIIPVSGVGG